MYSLEQELKDLCYEIVWKQVVEYPVDDPGGNPSITIIGATKEQPEFGQVVLVRFLSHQPTGGGSGGFLYKKVVDNRQQALAILSKMNSLGSLAPCFGTMVHPKEQGS